MDLSVSLWSFPAVSDKLLDAGILTPLRDQRFRSSAGRFPLLFVQGGADRISIFTTVFPCLHDRHEAFFI